MNRILLKRLGLGLMLLALIGLILPSVGSWFPSEPDSSQARAAEIQTMEPQFTEEGVGAFVDQNEDTIASFRLELAENAAETAQGMMYRRSVPDGSGMLFIMAEERPQSFWMRNTYVPLDIIYLKADGEVVSIQANAQPMSDMPLPSDGPAKYVLEIAGGRSAQFGIKPGLKWLWKQN
ncbi:MAG: DUF192 domain-containing protein [Flavobacteriaceae bacterium]|nr:DUF192 domain-containing protein [Flavobacteriaceae bacterium]